MASTWLRSGGDIAAVCRSMVESDEAWSVQARKFKNPDDYFISALRACNLQAQDDVALAVRLQAQLGQPLFQPRSPPGLAMLQPIGAGQMPCSSVCKRRKPWPIACPTCKAVRPRTWAKRRSAQAWTGKQRRLAACRIRTTGRGIVAGPAPPFCGEDEHDRRGLGMSTASMRRWHLPPLRGLDGKCPPFIVVTLAWTALRCKALVTKHPCRPYL